MEISLFAVRRVQLLCHRRSYFQSSQKRRKTEKLKSVFSSSHFTLYTLLAGWLVGLWMNGLLCEIFLSRLKLPNANKRNKATHSFADCQQYYKVIILSLGICFYAQTPRSRIAVVFFSIPSFLMMANYYFLASILFAKKAYCTHNNSSALAYLQWLMSAADSLIEARATICRRK